ncbi:sigma-70 family RNA polymerase sigma factor [Vallitalea guaymasensis]|uniref:sigma-70 family RNA polymerase sigma factor n=1 Tax=Vallitalea guaymasensis TaxID=1185412 RepID=UPI000DE2673B|nr:sigma-70 family RNA polymerase sigma factor [Vallitalea guaymasensis]
MKNDINVIETTAQMTAKKVVSELRRQGLLKDNRRTPFQKTETLLYNYNNFKSAINDKYEQIKTIQCEGIPKKSSSITSFSSSPTYEIKSDADKADEKIEAIEQSIQVTKNFIGVIDSAIDALRDDPYFEIIPMKYFESKSRDDIAIFFDVDASTISRHKNRLVNLLQIRLFSDEVIYQIFS